jgi:hypothetical protein
MPFAPNFGRDSKGGEEGLSLLGDAVQPCNVAAREGDPLCLREGATALSGPRARCCVGRSATFGRPGSIVPSYRKACAAHSSRGRPPCAMLGPCRAPRVPVRRRLTTAKLRVCSPRPGAKHPPRSRPPRSSRPSSKARWDGGQGRAGLENPSIPADRTSSLFCLRSVCPTPGAAEYFRLRVVMARRQV